MTLKSIIRIARAYAKLGDAVGSQITDVVNNPDYETICEQNPNALAMADREFLAVVKQAARDGGDEEVLQDIEELREAIRLAYDCEHERQEQPGEPPVDVCSSCGAVRR